MVTLRPLQVPHSNVNLGILRRKCDRPHGSGTANCNWATLTIDDARGTAGKPGPRLAKVMGACQAAFNSRQAFPVQYFQIRVPQLASNPSERQGCADFRRQTGL